MFTSFITQLAHSLFQLLSSGVPEQKTFIMMVCLLFRHRRNVTSHHLFDNYNTFAHVNQHPPRKRQNEYLSKNLHPPNLCPTFLHTVPECGCVFVFAKKILLFDKNYKLKWAVPDRFCSLSLDFNGALTSMLNEMEMKTKMILMMEMMMIKGAMMIK